MRSLDLSSDLSPTLPAPYRSEAFAEDLHSQPTPRSSTSARGFSQALLYAMPVLITLVSVVGIIVATPA